MATSLVSTLVALRFRVLGNSLKRSTWQLVAVIIGALYGLGVLFAAVAGLVALGFAPAELRATIIVLAGSVLLLGWVLIPLVATGTEQTLDPARLVQYPVPLGTLLVALTAAGVLGVPGIVTSIAALATALSWIGSPLAAIAALLCAVIGVLTCVVGSRMIAAVSVSLSSKRRYREITGILIFIPLILLGPIIVGVGRGLSGSSDALPGLARIVGWTPLGAAWAVPADIAAGQPGPAALKLLIALATLGVLVLVWRVSLRTALITPRAEARKRVARGKIGLFALMPATPAGAVAARSLTYWLRDPRYARQLIVVPLIPVLFYFYSRNDIGPSALLGLAGPLVAFLVAVTSYTDISYDGTAFATHVADGVRGRDDRLGRAAALTIVTLPLTLIVLLVSVGLSNSWVNLPALAGLTLGAFFSGVGLTAVTSARIVVAVPGAGDNPFRSSPGGGFTTALSSLAVWGILLLLTLPEIALAAAALLLGAAWLGWLALVVGVVLGALFAALGINRGGALLDRTAPELLTRLKTLRGA